MAEHPVEYNGYIDIYGQTDRLQYTFTLKET